MGGGLGGGLGGAAAGEAAEGARADLRASPSTMSLSHANTALTGCEAMEALNSSMVSSFE